MTSSDGGLVPFGEGVPHPRYYGRAGAVADVVVFDLEEFRDTATYADPHQYAEGVVHVLVNGRFAIADGEFTGELVGQVLGKKPIP